MFQPYVVIFKRPSDNTRYCTCIIISIHECIWRAVEKPYRVEMLHAIGENWLIHNIHIHHYHLNIECKTQCDLFSCWLSRRYPFSACLTRKFCALHSSMFLTMLNVLLGQYSVIVEIFTVVNHLHLKETAISTRLKILFRWIFTIANSYDLLK